MQYGEVFQHFEIIDNGDLGLGIGDIIKYTIYVENTMKVKAQYNKSLLSQGHLDIDMVLEI